MSLPTPLYPLVSVASLAADPQRYRILEVAARKAGDVPQAVSAREAFSQGHIPGSAFADLCQDFSDPHSPWPYQRPGAQAFSRAAQAAGIRQDQSIVVYDRSDGIWAARLWWLFRAYGHRRVQVLDGGLQAWCAAGLPLDQAQDAMAPGDFEARADDEAAFVDREQVLAVVNGERRAQLLNVLRRPVFTGAEQRYARAGHIPGSLHVAHGTLLDAQSGLLLPAAVLRERFALLNPHVPVITYCGSGITAAGTALALAVAGREDVAVYDGSLVEWSADPTLALVTSSD
ncbi:sulfurtransferase [Pseudomonas alkylphenolica]|uniref:Sulfurtransferase n=1 Tax=Pseudomonas alkylphenolica TaxID=237609 RepID=A0A443ZXZ8_9PSED|nr:rhodanese-like domain-containing protein [Pseudomonas alkylphenolica]RWU25603.1 sulfurtransferase [Pseudomonas alkylphenolica]